MKSLCPLFIGLASALVTIPPPNGPYGVSLVEFQLNDTSRMDPYTGKPFRVLPVTLIAPSGPKSACQSVLQPYVSNATAQYWEKALEEDYGVSLGNILSQLELSLCKPTQSDAHYPLVFFAPGLAFPGQLYRIQTTNLASQGYVVVQVGIPGEIGFIQFPDGQIEYGHTNFSDDPMGAKRAAALNVRAKDISFVLDYLSSPPKGMTNCIMPNINASSPSIFGQSFGGATSLATLIEDSRFAAGANEDGAFWGEALVGETDKPFMILAATPNYTRSLATVPNWAETWPHLHGPKWLASIKNTTHDSFADGGLIAEYTGLYKKAPALRKIFGEINAQELLKIEVDLLSEMVKLANGIVDGKDVTVVAGEFDGVEVLNSTLAKV